MTRGVRRTSTRISCDDTNIEIFRGAVVHDTLQTGMTRCVVYTKYMCGVNKNDEKVAN